MTTARQIIGGALTFHLNRLSPGETLDADLAAVCLDALNHIVDEWNGVKSFLFRELLSVSTPLSGVSGTLGTSWAGLSSGDQILGATVQYAGGMDIPIVPITMAQYAEIPLKTTASIPQVYAHDGAATVYFYPACAGQTVTLRTRQVATDFSGLDVDYVLPKGYKSALSAILAEKLSPVLTGGVTLAVASAAATARSQVMAQAVNPAILNAAGPTVNRGGGNILAGWR